MTVNRNITFRELRAMVAKGQVSQFEYEGIMIKINEWRNTRRNAESWSHMPSNGRAVRKSHASKMRSNWNGSNGQRTFIPSDTRAVEAATLGRHPIR